MRIRNGHAFDADSLNQLARINASIIGELSRQGKKEPGHING